MTIYNRAGAESRDARLRTERDRAMWAGETQILMEAEMEGAGNSTTEMIPFGVTFAGRPFFTWHVELLVGTLVPGDFPVVNCFVAAWDFTKLSTDTNLYKGASISIVVQSAKSYHLGFMFSFVGNAYKGPLA